MLSDEGAEVSGTVSSRTNDVVTQVRKMTAAGHHVHICTRDEVQTEHIKRILGTVGTDLKKVTFLASVDGPEDAWDDLLPRINPHNHLSRCGDPPIDRWRCECCRQEGTFDQLMSISCSHHYLPCPHCGRTPECAPDCCGISAALGGQGVYVAGFDPQDRH